LPFATAFQRRKRYRRGTYRLGALTGYWGPLGGLEFEAYEIRHGETHALAGPDARGALEAVLPNDCGWQYGQTLALYVHGLFESPAVMRALFGHRTPTLDDTLDGLADFIDLHFAAGALMGLVDRR
jgi:adenosylcobyric acid synthase